jgi:pSer/pThr/pTyr-binding forkhead associated (FHA) protein
VIKHGDIVRVGRVWLELRIEQVPATQNMPVATRELALALVARALSEQGETPSVTVRVVEGPSSGKDLAVAEFDRAYVIGRGKVADLPVEDPDLSRRHVEIVRRADRVFVKDLGSKNGSRLGDEPLQANKETHWTLGKVLALGAHRFVYEDPVRSALEELERAADEKLRADQSIDPPDDSDELAPEDAAPESLPESRSTAPLARRPARAAGSNGSGWTATDVLVAFIALVVLGLSIAGLLWLVGTG